MLSHARELVMSDYHNTMLGGGDALEDDPASAGACTRSCLVYMCGLE